MSMYYCFTAKKELGNHVMLNAVFGCMFTSSNITVQSYGLWCRTLSLVF